MPDSAACSSVRSACAGRPIAEAWPPPSTASGVRDLGRCRDGGGKYRLVGGVSVLMRAAAPRSCWNRRLTRTRRHHAATRPSSGNTLAGFSSQSRIETARTRICCSRSACVELVAHQVALLDADAVLARQAAADLHAELEDVVARLLGLLRLAGIVDIVDDQRMKVAVAGMEDVGDAQAVALHDLVHALQHERQLPRRDGAVHADIVGDAAGGAEGRFAAFPDRGASRMADFDSRTVFAPCARAMSTMRAEQVVHLGVRALDLDDQQGLDIERIAGMGEGLADLDGRLVHEFDRDRDDARADDGGDARRPPPRCESKPNSTGRAPSAARRMRTVASVTMPSCPSEPMTSAEQVVARRVHRVAADIDDRRRRAVTMRTPRMLLVVTPYFRQCAPPEFIAMLPAMVQASCVDGSGA